MNWICCVLWAWSVVLKAQLVISKNFVCNKFSGRYEVHICHSTTSWTTFASASLLEYGIHRIFAFIFYRTIYRSGCHSFLQPMLASLICNILFIWFTLMEWWNGIDAWIEYVTQTQFSVVHCWGVNRFWFLFFNFTFSVARKGPIFSSTS